MNDTISSQQMQDYERIEQAIQFLEANFRDHPSLEEIAASVNLSQYHFQRLFKRWAGISPSQFMQYLTIEYAKEQLQTAASVLNTALEAGLSGPGRLHDLFVTFTAVSPGEFKQQGAGLVIAYGFHPTPFGDCLLAQTERGICALRFVAAAEEEAALAALQQEWQAASFVEDVAATAVTARHIFSNEAWDGERPFHLLLRGTNFQIQVWQALLSIPAGAMVSYQDVAQMVGKPTATRAVASAIAHNPIGYLIPCHRVISKVGQTHQYRWGSARKKAILGWEAAQYAAT
ncbi:MAG: methylated-DNA--[protein]-cysteine S-methyltransferase [Ardenticatenaceae bacterium]|nr:methylated-DNA--[protein]-cysteine S-methyltransferase [Ardenticatenaceae bacterium]